MALLIGQSTEAIFYRYQAFPLQTKLDISILIPVVIQCPRDAYSSRTTAQGLLPQTTLFLCSGRLDPAQLSLAAEGPMSSPLSSFPCMALLAALRTALRPDPVISGSTPIPQNPPLVLSLSSAWGGMSST